MTDTEVRDVKFRTLGELGKKIDAERRESGDEKKPYVRDTVLRYYGTGEELIVRTFERFGYDIGRRGVYFLKTGEDLVRLGSTDISQRERENRRGISCLTLDRFARAWSITPMSKRDAELRAETYLKSRYSQ